MVKLTVEFDIYGYLVLQETKSRNCVKTNWGLGVYKVELQPCRIFGLL